MENNNDPPGVGERRSNTNGTAIHLQSKPEQPSISAATSKTQQNNITPGSPDGIPGAEKNWVKFEEDDEGSSIDNRDAPAVITTESVQVNLERSFSKADDNLRTPVRDVNVNLNAKPQRVVEPLRNVELPMSSPEPIRQGFSNGDIIVTLLPVNTRFPWITPAEFRPELVPEELMAQGLTLTVEEYVQAMELLVNDYRFNVYNVCYKRVLVLWIIVAFSVLLGLLFSGLSGLTLFGLGIGWLVLNASAIFFSMWIKFRLSRNLEKCLAHVNKQLLRHKIVIVLDDRGKISCHKVNLCFLYMDSGPCIAHLQTSIEQQEREPSNNWEQRMDITADDIVIQGSRSTRLSRKQGRAEQLFLRYLQRWGKDFIRRRLDWSLEEIIMHYSTPRHVPSALCPCQYVEEILANKPSGDQRAVLVYLRYISRWGRDRVRGYLASPPAKGGRHCNTLTCPCQYIDDHLSCKPPTRFTILSFFSMPVEQRNQLPHLVR